MIKRWQAPVKVVQSNPLKDEYCRWVGPRIAFIGPNFEAPIVLIKRISPSVWLSLDSYFIEHQNTNIFNYAQARTAAGAGSQRPLQCGGMGEGRGKLWSGRTRHRHGLPFRLVDIVVLSIRRYRHSFV